jgi:large subunit ribosomal protein L24
MLLPTAKLKPKVKRGDLVKVTTGKDKGKTGKVLRIDRKNWRVVVEKINMIKRHTKPTQSNPTGGIVEKEAGIHISNVQVMEKGKK